MYMRRKDQMYVYTDVYYLQASRFPKVPSVPYCPDRVGVQRSVLHFIAEHPWGTGSNSTAYCRRHRDIYRSCSEIRHMSRSIDHSACSSCYRGRWNYNRFDTASLKILLTKLIQLSLDQTVWDGSENKLKGYKHTILHALVFSCSGGLPATNPIKPCFIWNFHLL